MKCNSFLPPNPDKKRGKKFAPVSWWSTGDLGPFTGEPTSKELIERGYTVCQGTIRAEVKLEYGPYRDDENVGASYCCDSCGQDFFMGFPTDATGLSAWMTRAIELFDFEAHVRDILEQRRLEEERTREMMARHNSTKKT